jgi:hypothetical protein
MDIGPYSAATQVIDSALDSPWCALSCLLLRSRMNLKARDAMTGP